MMDSGLCSFPQRFFLLHPYKETELHNVITISNHTFFSTCYYPSFPLNISSILAGTLCLDHHFTLCAINTQYILLLNECLADKNKVKREGMLEAFANLSKYIFIYNVPLLECTSMCICV